MKIKRAARGAAVTFSASDAAYLATILSYARNVDISPAGTDASQRRGRKMLFALAGMAVALDGDACAYLHGGSEINAAEREAYGEARRIFDPEYGETT